jgi:DNA uptake protein ComE-like DNA-binding protein
VISQPPALRTINLNNVSADQFRAHPYVKWNLANAIVNYRSQHGPFQSLDDLKKIMLVEEGWLNKMRPYLALQ